MNKTFDLELDRAYKDCVTATLPLANSAPPTQDLLLSKVRVSKPSDCLKGESNERLDDLICVAELTSNDDSSRIREDDATRVLICSTVQASRSR